MKKLISILGLCLLPFMCFAQLRSQVCIVRQNYSEKLIQTVKEFEPRLTNLQVEDVNKYFEDFENNGAFGSGFIYVAPNGKNYVITNRHVVEGGHKFQIIFHNEDGDIELDIKDVAVLAASSDIDVAILELPQVVCEKGMEFYKERLHDGDSVYTAGFPALLGKPSWQFGAGVITNSSVKSELLINPEISTVIQHSSQIDAGNSGGPLLTKTESGEYKIIGINTWKISNRQDTNFSIPIATVENFINQALSEEGYTEPEPETVILKQSKDLQKILNNYIVTNEDVAPFISIDYVAEEGSVIFNKVARQCSTENLLLMNAALKGGAPVEAIKFAIGWYLYTNFHKNEQQLAGQTHTVNEKDLPEIPAPVKYEDSDIWYSLILNPKTNKYLKIEWCQTTGGWQIWSCNVVSKNQSEDENVRLYNKNTGTGGIHELDLEESSSLGSLHIYLPTLVSLSYASQIEFSFDATTFVHYIDTEVKLNNFMSVDVTAELVQDTIKIYHYGDKFSSISNIKAFAGIQFQLPIWNPNSIIMPYATIQAGCGLGKLTDIEIDVRARAELGYRCNYFLGAIDQSLFFDFNCSFETGIKNIYLKPKINMGVGLSL